MCPNTFPHPVQLLAAIYIFARVRIKNKAMEQFFYMFHGFKFFRIKLTLSGNYTLKRNNTTSPSFIT